MLQNEVSQEKTESNILQSKFYTIRSMQWCTILGGPLGGFYLMAVNFNKFGQKAQARNTMIIGFIVTLLLFLITKFVPYTYMNKIPDPVIPITLGIIISLNAKKLQQKNIDYCLDNGWKKYSAWKCFLVSIISIALTIILFVLLNVI